MPRAKEWQEMQKFLVQGMELETYISPLFPQRPIFTVNDTDLWNPGNVSVIKIFIKAGNSLVNCTAEKINLS